MTTTKTYGILTTKTLNADASDEQITECVSEEEARTVFEAIKRGEGDGFGYPASQIAVAALVELAGASPFLASDGTEVAPTHAPCDTLETWTVGEEITMAEPHRDGDGHVIGLDCYAGSVLVGLAQPEDSLGDGTVRIGGEIYGTPIGTMDRLRAIGDERESNLASRDQTYSDSRSE